MKLRLSTVNEKRILWEANKGRLPRNCNTKGSNFYTGHRVRFFANQSLNKQCMLSESQRWRILYFPDHHPIAENPGLDKVYDTSLRSSYCPRMARKVYLAVAQWARCAQNRNHYEPRRHFQLFPANGPLEVVGTNILARFSKTVWRNEYNFIITGRYPKIFRPIPAFNTLTSRKKNRFLDNSIVLLEIPTFLFTDRGTQFVTTVLQSARRQ